MKSKKFTANDILQSKVAKLNPHVINPSREAKKSKFNNVRTSVNGNDFDSKKEAKRYKELKILLQNKTIMFLARQVEFSFHIESKKIASYFADFVYMIDGELVVEDVKSEATRKLPVYRLKKKMMEAQNGIIIKEY